MKKAWARTAGWSLAGLLALMCAGPAHAELTGTVLQPALPRVIGLPPAPQHRPIPLNGSLTAWNGRLAHIAGSAHYDRGEWIYEDYPYTAYGAALPSTVQLFKTLGLLGGVTPGAQRLPGGTAEVQSAAGAGPLVDQADLSQLRVAIRGGGIYVLARTTAMTAPVRTALLLLFDTGRAGVSRTVPFGSGLQTTRADTAALVTAGGTRIVDLVTGHVTQAPAAANPKGYTNVLETRLPLRLVVAPGGSQLRMVAATGVADPRSFQLSSGGAAGPLAKVVPRFGVPVQAVYDRAQAIALEQHDIDQFFTTISLARLRRGDSQRLMPGIGYTVRTLTAPAAISHEGETDGVLRDYGLYIPRGFSWRQTPATLVLRGSGMTAHSLAAITPGLFQQLGDDNGAIVISPGGRSDFDLFEGAAYLDAQQALADAERLLPIDPNRLSVAGYSMGGGATYLFAETQPDRFARAFVIEGPVGGEQPETKTPIVNAEPDLVPLLSNLSYTPVEIYQGEHDADVPVTNGLAAAQRLQSLGLRYRLNIFPGDHFTPGIWNDYTLGAAYLKGAVREAHPAEVRFSRVMPFEHAIDTGLDSDQPLAGHSVGLRFDHAWFVSHLDAADPQHGTATIDVRTLARPEGGITPVRTQGTDPGTLGGAPASVFDQQDWQLGPANAAPRNALSARLTGASSVTLDLRGMGLTAARPLAASIDTDTRVLVTLALSRRMCLTSTIDNGRASRARKRRQVVLVLSPGAHHVELEPGACGPAGHRRAAGPLSRPLRG